MRRTPKAFPAVNRSNFAAIRPQIEHVVIGRIATPSRQLKKHSKAHIAKLAAGISRYGLSCRCWSMSIMASSPAMPLAMRRRTVFLRTSLALLPLTSRTLP